MPECETGFRVFGVLAATNDRGIHIYMKSFHRSLFLPKDMGTWPVF
jgi:hypothetical protein